MGSYHDDYHLAAFKRAISAIAGRDNPPRAKLGELGRELAIAAGRARPWTGAYLYLLLNLQKLSHPERFGVNADLFDAAMNRAGMLPLNGTHKVCVIARSVRPGAVVLGRSRRCARRRCGIHFIGRTPNQRYCSQQCECRVAAYRRKERRRMRREKARRRR